ncbi:DUF4249 domain-containing protein [Mucilaginibacter antarcticus]|uniref:DUF4249 domain-containing protein n=2 Tax=Mucilaginibacter antarcticus TaxID=1855725 RepID=A0ABW5XS32_9SPHI
MSCKEVVDIKPASTTPQLVIEGKVTDQLAPQVVSITKSVPLANSNSYPTVSGAVVKITDQNNVTRTLIERSPGTYSSASFIGRMNLAYTLNVTVEGQTYTAKSVMPEKVLIDSIALSVQRFGNSTTKTILVFYQDAGNAANQYKFVLSINGVLVKQIFARNDQFNNGKFVQQLLYQDDIKLQSGDRVDIEMQCIDKNVYAYWYTFTQQGGGFNSTTPTNPPNNFNSDKVLGIFSAHTSQHKNIIIP